MYEERAKQWDVVRFLSFSLPFLEYQCWEIVNRGVVGLVPSKECDLIARAR